MILPRFDGVGKGGIYNSIKGEQDGKATENLHPRVQSGGGAARQGQRQTDEPGSARARDQRQCPVEVVQAIRQPGRASLSGQWASNCTGGGTSSSEARTGSHP